MADEAICFYLTNMQSADCFAKRPLASTQNRGGFRNDIRASYDIWQDSNNLIK